MIAKYCAQLHQIEKKYICSNDSICFLYKWVCEVSKFSLTDSFSNSYDCSRLCILHSVYMKKVNGDNCSRIKGVILDTIVSISAWPCNILYICHNQVFVIKRKLSWKTHVLLLTIYSIRDAGTCINFNCLYLSLTHKTYTKYMTWHMHLEDCTIVIKINNLKTL